MNMLVSREHDRVDPQFADLTPFFGKWTKTNEEPGQWIESVEIAPDGKDGIRVQVWGADAPSPSDWGAVRADALFATAITSNTGCAFIAHYDFGFMQSELQGNVNLGLLVLAGYHHFRDGRGSDLFSREFYRKADAQ
jgi:hypothetical protein